MFTAFIVNEAHFMRLCNHILSTLFCRSETFTLQKFHYISVGWKPLHRFKLFRREPTGSLCFEQAKVAFLHVTQIALHVEVKGWIVIVDRSEQTIYTDEGIEFFLYFTS